MKYLIASLVIVLFAALEAHGANTYPDLLSNGGMEKIVKDLPKGWQTFSFGTAAQFSVDTVEHHGGSHSVRMTASEAVRSYLVSDYFPVAVGETFLASAWVKCQGVQKKGGNVILIAEYANSKDQTLEIESCGSANPQQLGWQRLEKQIKVPEPATKMRLRMGFSYSSGTTWWDDASLVPLDPVTMQVDIEPEHFVPGFVPINILNRAGIRENVRVDVTIRRPSKSDPGNVDQLKALVSQDVSNHLTGESVQHVDVPAAFDVRGKLKLTAMLLPAQNATPIFSRQVDVHVPDPLTLKPLVPTHWAVEDGPAHIDGRIDVVLSDADRQGANLSVQLLDANKTVRARWASNGSAALPDGIASFALAAGDLPMGEYQVVADLHLQRGKSIESEQPWFVISRRRSRTTINAAGYPEIDGKAIYPLGMFNGRPKEEGEAGFTVSHAYNAARITPGGYHDDQQAKDFLDRTEKAGTHACFMVPLEWAYAGKWDDFRRRIRMFRNHPALLCWDEEEGVARGNMTLDTLENAAQIVHTEDPNHPLMIGDARDVIGRITNRADLLPKDIMDMGMWWWYPFPIISPSGNALDGDEDANVDEISPPVFLATQTNKPIWTSLQAYKKNKTSRYPTAQEYRAQAYIGVISGAKGLMWYGGYVDGGIYHDPVAGHWTALAEVVKQLRELSPVIMSSSAVAPTFTPKDAPISAALKDGPNGPVLLVANRRNTPVDVTFDIAKLPLGRITVLYENRTVSPHAGKLTDHFDGYGVHVYQFKSE